MKPANHWGAIFDWDGVVVDSSRAHEESWERLAREINLPIFEGHFKKGFGMKSDVVVRDVLCWTDQPERMNLLARRKEELYREILGEKGFNVVPGSVEWIRRLRAGGVPCAVASSTTRANIELALDRLGLRADFQQVVSAENVDHGKPHPEVFLKAAAALNFAPEQCVVFEDALVGIEAARRAGCRVVAITTTNTRENLACADLVVDRLDELTLEQMAVKSRKFSERGKYSSIRRFFANHSG